MDAYIIRGTWSGYRPEQRLLCHVEITTDEALVDFVRRVARIRFTDETYLELTAEKIGAQATAISERPTYNRLIHQCCLFGVDTVEALEAKRKEVQNGPTNGRSVLDSNQSSRI